MAYDDIIEFYKRHCEMGGVVVVYSDDLFIDGIFSSLDKAKAYMEANDKASVIAPYVIDEPEFGNVPFSEQN